MRLWGTAALVLTFTSVGVWVSAWTEQEPDAYQVFRVRTQPLAAAATGESSHCLMEHGLDWSSDTSRPGAVPMRTFIF